MVAKAARHKATNGSKARATLQGERLRGKPAPASLKRRRRKTMPSAPPPAIGGTSPPDMGGDRRAGPQYVTKYGTTAKTPRYHVRAQHWTLQFNPRVLKTALLEIRRVAKSHPFLAAGTSPNVQGNCVHLTWQQAVLGKSIYGHFFKSSPGKLGGGGSCSWLNFWPTPHGMPPSTSSPIGAEAPAITDIATASVTENIPAASLTDKASYPELPIQLARTSFNAQQCLDIVAVRAAMEEYGFLVLRDHIPERLHTTARQEAIDYFLGVLRSFEHGYSIDKGLDGFDELGSLPGWLWERKKRTPKTCRFIPGDLGMVVDTATSVVTSVQVGGQACQNGIRPGWQVQRAYHVAGTARRLTSLAEWIQKQQTGESQVTFQPPMSYSPLAAKQKWGTWTSIGYQTSLGLGKCTDAENFKDCAGIMNCQLWMRNFLAGMHDCMPTDLVWQPDGVSIKAGSSIFSKYIATSSCSQPSPQFRMLAQPTSPCPHPACTSDLPMWSILCPSPA